MKQLLLDQETRIFMWEQVFETIEDYIDGVESLPVSPPIDVEALRSAISDYDFNDARDPRAVVEFVAGSLRRFQVHTPHPAYFGLFNPAPTAAAIAADALVAAFNPQIAAWSHNPFAAEVEQHLIRAFAARFGYAEDSADGTFCSGGAEANHTALIAALVHHFPQFDTLGVRALEKQPVFYVSTQSHHSFVKAARFCGLGTDAVREIGTDENFRMSVEQLEAQIERDRADGLAPFMIVATAGTTNGGTVDDIAAIARIAERENCWLHADAAWGGAAVFVPELKPALAGIERADSITFDAHKWLSVPMGAGIFLTRRADILYRACRITTDYMPRDAARFGVTDPFTHSLQWSRRFIGLKVFMSLAVAGWDGYEAAIRHQSAMGDVLRAELERENWEVINKTPLPVVCFRDATHPEGGSEAYLNAVSAEVVASGGAWISPTRLSPEHPVLRACITNFRTREEHVRSLIRLLGKARKALARQRQE